MRAFVAESYGTPELMRQVELARPTPEDDEVLIRIKTVSINGSDKENLAGKPLYARFGGLRRPRNPIPGSDIAGVVEEVGKNHTDFVVGQTVFGEIPGYRGGFADYVATTGETMMVKPDALSLVDAAAIPQAGVIALNGITKRSNAKPGSDVLINGAGGSGGSFAIQLAKLAGANVTAVDGRGKLDFMQSLGADNVVDYQDQDFTQDESRYDLILDLIATRSAFSCAKPLRPGGSYYMVGGAMSSMLQVLTLGPLFKRFKDKRVKILVVPQNRPDLVAITEQVTSGNVTPAIDRIFSFEEIPDAMTYMASGEPLGKVVIQIA